MQTATSQQLIKLLQEDKKDFFPWLNCGEARSVLYYCFTREAFRGVGEDLGMIVKKLVLDFCYIYLGCNPDYPFPVDYEFAEEVLELEDCWNHRSTYHVYEHLPKPKSDRGNRQKGAYYTIRNYECCDEVLEQFKQEWGITTTELMRYLATRYAELSLGG